MIRIYVMEEDNPFLNLLRKHWGNLLFVLLAIACVAVWAERYYSTQQIEGKNDYIVAQRFLDQFQKGEPLQLDAIAAIEQIVERHPELHPKYDSLLALTLLAQNNTSQSSNYIDSSLKRASGLLPQPYVDYAQATLCLAQENYDAAWQTSTELDQKIAGHSEYTMLEGMNKLRLVFLADMRNDATHKNLYWEQLTQHSSFSQINLIFLEGKMTLADFVEKKIP